MNALFIAALDLRDHPLKTAKKKIRAEYALALSYLVSEVVIQAEEKRYTSERLKMYQNVLLPGAEVNTLFPIRNGISCIRKLRRKKLRYLLAYDVALILPDGVSTMQAVSIINSCLSTRNQIDVDRMAAILSGKIDIDKKLLFVAPLIVQYRMNQAFLSQPERRIIITANTSAGKSTLINALIGKPLARTSQEVCTGNVCYFFNKAFEDNNEGKNVTTKTEMAYSDNSNRPDKITVTVTADEKDTVYKFDNNMDGSLRNEIPENGKDAVQDKLDRTGGEVSSTKEEYDENGSLTETTVYITYESEPSVNYRTSILIEGI